MTTASDTAQIAQEDVGDSSTQTLTFRISEELAEKIASSAAAAKMNRSAMLRLAVDRGIDRLLEQLEVKP